MSFNDLFDAILLGLIEGFTEFLPISSTGHLLIAQHWLGPRSELFNIAIQSGAILAVTLVYRARLLELATGWRNPEARDYVFKLAAAFMVTAVLSLVARALGAGLPDQVWPVATALIVGGVAILWVERRVQALAPRSDVTWAVALAVGLAQVLSALFPGTSRSAAAIFAAMLAGLSLRPRAAEFAFLVGIPTMFAATGYAALETLTQPAAVRAESWGTLGVAFGVAALSGFVAVRWLLRYISAHSFVPFAWYRIALGAALLAGLGTGA